MAKALFVTYLIALSIGSTIGYSQECAIGPEYWCKSFENAQDCGAIIHCTDTVWNNDNKYTLVDSSKACQWCQRILEYTHKEIEQLGDNKDLIVSILTKGCNVLPSNDFSSKCINMIENYETSVISLMKNKRYTTLCHLMSICSNELITEKPAIILGNHRCTWGPSYWCSSLSNSRECKSIDHCSNEIWSKQSIEKKEKDNICQYCEYIIEKLRSFITDNKTEINIEKWLSGACKMLPTKDAINECVKTMSQYAEEILVLIKNNIDPGIICHLGEMCKEATIIIREEKKVLSINEQSDILCNVIVRATYELHINQQKNLNEIKEFLINDCQKLSTSELIQKCENLINQHGNNIYEHIVNNMELSKICNYINDPTALQSVHCELCRFVLTTTKYMFDTKQSEEKILLYIDEQLCSHLYGDIKKNCKYMIEINGKDLINNIQHPSMLLCTHFQVCLNELIDKTSPIQKDEMYSFLKEDICDQLGPFENSCNALIEKDTTRLLKTFINDIEGDVLCQMFGICPIKMPFIDNLLINDNKNKCKRCIEDFTRRKHIAEKLVNYSSAFLHHLCEQLPQKDECIKSVDESINKLIQFTQSLNPKDICIELKMCNATSLEEIQISLSNNIINQEIIVYIKNEICTKLGSLSNLCIYLMNSECENLFNLITKDIDPHKVCDIIDVCPTTIAFENCNDKCECCMDKIENYQVELASFLQTILSTIRVVCEHMPDSEECRNIADGFELNVNEIIDSFNSKRICQLLTHCPVSPANTDINGDKCQCCQDCLDFRQDNFRTTINEITTNLVSLCTDNNCRSIVQINQQQTLNQINKINSLTLCQRIGFCSFVFSSRSIPFLSNLMTKTYHDIESSIEDLSDNICIDFGDIKPICKHLITSRESSRYANVYMALLKNNSTLIDDDLNEQDTDTCDACKNAIQSSKDFWINALESVRNVLLQTCEHCPSKDQCQNFINQNFNNLKSYVDKINPEEFCQTIHLCSISLINTCSTCIERLQLRQDAILQAIDRLAGYFNDLCQKYAEKQCQIYVQHLHDLIQKSFEEFNSKQTCTLIGFCTINSTENEINFNQYEYYLENEIEKNICSILGPFEILCKQIIYGDIKQIQELKINYDIKDLMQIGEELTEELDKPNPNKCRSCIIKIIRKKLRTKFIGNHIFSALIRSCKYCPAKHKCRKHWQHAKFRFNSHINHIKPKRVCTHLGFCNKSLLEETKEITQIDQSNSTCILCEYIMNILSNYIHQQSTEEEIEQNLEKVCNEIPTILQNQCYDYIDNYGPSIISTLIQEFDLSTICHKLNLCTQQMNINITYITKANAAICGICDYIATYIHFILKRDTNEKSLQYTLSNVCTHLSDEQSPKCQIIVQLFSPYMRQLELSPGKNFCKQLTICQIPMIELIPAVPLISESSVIDKSLVQDEAKKPSIVENIHITPKCTLCHYIFSYLDAILKNNISEEAVQDALSKVCTILPNKERAQCNELITSYGPVLAQLIAEMADPDTVCRYIGWCQDFSTKKSTTVTDYIHVQTPYTCTICQFIISRMKHFVGLNQGENEVFTSLKESCDLFTVINLKEQCKDFLDQHGSYFYKTIFNDIEPKIACRSIGTCGENYQESITTTTAPMSSSTRYGKCIFGMNYWCTSRANAELCNAVELCEREVWSKKNILIT